MHIGAWIFNRIKDVDASRKFDLLLDMARVAQAAGKKKDAIQYLHEAVRDRQDPAAVQWLARLEGLKPSESEMPRPSIRRTSIKEEDAAGVAQRFEAMRMIATVVSRMGLKARLSLSGQGMSTLTIVVSGDGRSADELADSLRDDPSINNRAVESGISAVVVKSGGSRSSWKIDGQ